MALKYEDLIKKYESLRLPELKENEQPIVENEPAAQESSIRDPFSPPVDMTPDEKVEDANQILRSANAPKDDIPASDALEQKTLNPLEKEREALARVSQAEIEEAGGPAKLLEQLGQEQRQPSSLEEKEALLADASRFQPQKSDSDLERARLFDTLSYINRNVAKFGKLGVDPGQTQFERELLAKKAQEQAKEAQAQKKYEPFKLGKKMFKLNPDSGEYEVVADASETQKKKEGPSTDPLSAASESARQFFKTQGYKIPESLSEAQLDRFASKLKDPDGKTKDLKGPTEVDKNFAPIYTKYFVEGKLSDLTKQIDQLEDVKKDLEGGTNLTGPLLGLLPKAVRASVNPESVSTQEAIEEVVQRNLRLILGAQFTEEEGKRLIDRAYNPLLGEKENLKRTKRLIDQMKNAMRNTVQAAKHYDEHKTLRNYKGSTGISANEFYSKIDGAKADKVVVKLPGGRTGRIDRDKLDKFKEKYPSAEIAE